MHCRGSRRKIEREGDSKCIQGNFGWKLPKPDEGNRFSDIGITEGTKPRWTQTDSHKDIPVKMEKFKRFKTHQEENRVLYKEISKKLWADFSLENLQARKECHYIFKVLKGKILQPGIL